MHGMWGGDKGEMVYWCVTVWVLGVDDEHGNGHEEKVKTELPCSPNIQKKRKRQQHLNHNYEP